jgi:imidazoleglycerol-phosphate dehydratase
MVRKRHRTAEARRQTRETDISVRLDLDGAGAGRIETGIPFLNHMLELLAKHAGFDLDVRASGDLAVDYHHTVEDLGLVLGDALNQALGDRSGIARYGWALLPMDESLSLVAIDLGGRPFLVYEIASRKKRIRDFDVGLIEEFFRALVTQARMNLHVAHLYGQEPHHAYESVFKGVARALSTACAHDPRARGIPSSKGVI